jgi:methyl-accepting chemotaxis protein
MAFHFSLRSRINALSYQKKFWIIACVFIFTCIFIGGLLHLEQDSQIKKMECQIRGIQYYRAISALFQDERLYKFYAANMENYKEDLFQLERTIQEHFENAIEQSDANEHRLKLSYLDLEQTGVSDLHIKNIKRQWQETQKLHRRIDFERFHIKLKDLSDYIIATAHLTSLQDLELSFLMDTAFYEVQEVAERFDQCMELLEKKESATAVATVLQAHLGTIEASLRKAYDQDEPSIRKQTEVPLHDYLALMNTMVALIVKGDGAELQRNYVIVCTESEKFSKALLDTMEPLLAGNLYTIRVSYRIDFGLGILMLCVAIFLGFYFEAGIRKPLKDLEQAAKAFGEGNLAARAVISTHDGIGKVGLAFNDMAASIQRLIEKVKKASSELQTVGGEVSDIAKKQKDAFAIQDETCSQISKHASAIIGSTKKFSDVLALKVARSKESYARAADGAKSLHTMEEGLQAMVKDIAVMVSERKTLLGKITNLSTIVGSLNKVSDEVNLLALNAAIESEKAGQSNKGFSLISEAITKLAQETAATTAQITQEISAIQAGVGQTVINATSVGDAIAVDTTELERIEKIFTAICSNIEHVNAQFESVFGELAAQEKGSHEIEVSLATLQASLRATTEAVSQFVSAMGHLKQISQEISA